jgi:hypothetical protein
MTSATAIAIPVHESTPQQLHMTKSEKKKTKHLFLLLDFHKKTIMRRRKKMKTTS